MQSSESENVAAHFFWIAFAVIIASVAVNEYACPTEQGSATNVTAKGPCDVTLWQHIYHRPRLVVKTNCVTVTGVVQDATRGKQKDGCRHEADGDGHCWLKLDPGQENYLAPNNLSKQGGNLVFEPICRYRVTQADAVAACKGWTQKLTLPPVGSHVKITGAFVFDNEHKHNEIHPVTSIEIIP